MSYGTVQAEKMTTESGYSLGAGNASSFKNRIINGEMDIDQRNAGAAVTPTNAGTYTLDRWLAVEDTDGAITVQRSSAAPSGFNNSLLVTVTSPDASLAPTQYSYVAQRIEGFNVSDLAWGTASAQSVTVSFWVRSSQTGTFGGSIQNGGSNRSYPFNYTIASANTWEQKTITIPGDTSGTWLRDNGTGLSLIFTLASGSSFTGTANVWTAANIIEPTGAVDLIATNGATWQITGVQLEVGTVATSFDFRDFGRELMLCQRYFESSYNIGSTPSNLLDLSAGVFAVGFSAGIAVGATGAAGFRVSKRAIPTVTTYSYNGTAGGVSTPNSAATAVTGVAVDRIGHNGFGQLAVASGFTVGQWYWFGYTASAEL